MQVQYFKRRKGQHSLALFCATGVPTTFQSHCETTLHYHCRQSWLLPVKPAFLTNTSQDYQHGLVSARYTGHLVCFNSWNAACPKCSMRLAESACTRQEGARLVLCLRIRCASLSHSQNHAVICTRIISFLHWPWPFLRCSHRAPRETWISTVGAASGVFCQSYYAASKSASSVTHQQMQDVSFS